MRRLKKAFLVLLLLPFQIQNTDQLNIGDFNVKEKTLLEIFSLNNFWLLPQTEMSENFTIFVRLKVFQVKNYKISNLLTYERKFTGIP